ncbi:DJ-1/PfpI family protein [archaeon]|jgi:protease I|nr:DJ-1/PfpI family protein [archaeon]MBT6698041.1 DJ-1/PfpI family protein [archaeon]
MRIAFIIANDGYQDNEYLLPKEFLTNKGHIVTTVAKELGTAKGSLGGTTEVNLTLDELNIEEFKAIVFVGGPGAPVYQEDSKAHEIIKQTLEQNKLLAAICIAPMTLAKAGALRGKNTTVWNGDTQQAVAIESFGATYLKGPVVIDNNIITANGPEAAKEFAKAISKYLEEQESLNQVQESQIQDIQEENND